jgi:hypothetical protein
MMPAAPSSAIRGAAIKSATTLKLGPGAALALP